MSVYKRCLARGSSWFRRKNASSLEFPLLAFSRVSSSWPSSKSTFCKPDSWTGNLSTEWDILHGKCKNVPGSLHCRNICCAEIVVYLVVMPLLSDVNISAGMTFVNVLIQILECSNGQTCFNIYVSFTSSTGMSCIGTTYWLVKPTLPPPGTCLCTTRLFCLRWYCGYPHTLMLVYFFFLFILMYLLLTFSYFTVT